MLLLLVDCSYLCHRAFHTTGGLSYGGVPTGVAYGVLRDVENQMEFHGADRAVLAFDHPGPGLRSSLCPSYKSERRSKRENLTDEERESLRGFYDQVDRLKNRLLPMSGYRNVVEVEGYEADDIIAKYALDVSSPDEAVIISADNDLLQCLNQRVRFHNPTSKKTTTSLSFIEEWGIPPEQWSHVKALAGCLSDSIKGIRGIGEKSAAGWFSGKLKKGKKYDLIHSNLDVLVRNLPLVKLPFDGIEVPVLVDDDLNESRKTAVNSELGVRSRGRGGARARGHQGQAFGFDV